MAPITPSTFDPRRKYVHVRLQQGVPLADADWNEQDDVRQFELRSALRWYVGDGTPDGNDAFRIIADELDNDFVIGAGVPEAPADAEPVDAELAHAGRCLVAGLEVRIDRSLRFSDQPLHADQPDSAATAALLGVPEVAPLTTPTASGTVLAYLDVWERAVGPDEDPSLVLTGLGVETCARVRREWVVRVRAGTTVPTAGDADHLGGHHYLPLAVLRRAAGIAAVIDAEVDDRRQTRLLVPPSHLLTDTLGVEAVAYRRGEDRPPISLREAINALLAGELPSTPDMAVSPATGVDVLRRGVAVDGAGGLVAIWQSERVGSRNQVVASRLDLANWSDGFSTAQVLTTGGPHAAPTAVAVGGADLVVAYQNGLTARPETDVVMKRGSFASLAGAPEGPVAATSGSADERPFAVAVDDLVVVFTYQRAANSWGYSRYRHTDDALLDTTPVLLADGVLPNSDLHAAAVDGIVWCAFAADGRIDVRRLNPATGTVDAALSEDLGGGSNGAFVVAEGETAAQVYWRRGGGVDGISHAVFAGDAWGSITRIPGSTGAEAEPAAVVDATGRTWLFFSDATVGAGRDIAVRTRSPLTGDWSDARRVIAGPGNDLAPHPVMVPGQGIWLFWMSVRDGQPDLFAKRIVTSI